MSIAELLPPVPAPPREGAPARSYDPCADPPTDTPFEVVNGVRVEKVMSAFEQYLGGIIYRRLADYADATDRGRAVVEVKFAIPLSDNDRQPDAGFLSYDRWPKSRGVPKRNAWPAAPDLAVEVISPNDKGYEIVAKVREYFAGGVRAVWVVWPNVEQVYCYSSPTTVRILGPADDLTDDPVVPGFRVPVAGLFPAAEDDPPAA